MCCRTLYAHCVSADLYHIEFERSENISNLLQGKYIEPSEATAYRQNQNSFCGHRSSASYALIKDYKSIDKSNAKALLTLAFQKWFAYLPGGVPPLVSSWAEGEARSRTRRAMHSIGIYEGKGWYSRPRSCSATPRTASQFDFATLRSGWHGRDFASQENMSLIKSVVLLCNARDRQVLWRDLPLHSKNRRYTFREPFAVKSEWDRCTKNHTKGVFLLWSYSSAAFLRLEQCLYYVLYHKNVNKSIQKDKTAWQKRQKKTEKERSPSFFHFMGLLSYQVGFHRAW